MNFSVTKNGMTLDSSQYTWNPNTRIFSTNKFGLVLDFREWESVTFKTGGYCAFHTGSDCTFDTGGDCNFDTGGCCNFDTEGGCNFRTGGNCIFDTGSGCTFSTGSGCTFSTGSGCTFTVGERCVIVRREIFEIIQPTEGVTIKLRKNTLLGYDIIPKEKTKEELVKEVLEKIQNLSREGLEKILQG